MNEDRNIFFLPFYEKLSLLLKQRLLYKILFFKTYTVFIESNQKENKENQ